MKEKYEKINELKCKFIEIIDEQLEKDLRDVDAKELGEVTDMAKDMAEIIKLCSESEYYFKITEAMDKNTNESNMGYIEKYIPEYAHNVYENMHFKNVNDEREGKSFNSRKEFIIAYESGNTNKKDIEFNNYINDISEDFVNVAKIMSKEEINVFKQKLIQLLDKM